MPPLLTEAHSHSNRDISHSSIAPKKDIDNKVQQIVKQTLLELTITLGIHIVVLSYTRPHVILLSTIPLAVGIVHTVAVATYQYFKEINHSTNHPVRLNQNIARFSFCNIFLSSAPNTLIHELGHAACAKLLFVNANPTISISLFRGGTTRYAISYGLTPLGKKLGVSSSLVVNKACGMGASTIYAIAAFIFGHYLEDSHPNISEFLTIHGVSQILGDFIPSCLAVLLLPERQLRSNDLGFMWQVGGIHPAIPLFLLIAIPATVKGALILLNKRKQDKISVP